MHDLSRSSPPPPRLLPVDHDATLAIRAEQPLATHRLDLRPLHRIEDAQRLHPHITAAITRLWIGWDTPTSLADTQAMVRNALDRQARGAYAGWTAYRRQDGGDGRTDDASFVGLVSLERLDAPVRDAWFELNFWVIQGAWGQGYAHEMAVAVLDWAATTTGLRRITLSWTQGNEGSRRVIERLTGGQEAQVHPAMKSGVERPVHHYEVSLDQWSNRRAQGEARNG